MRVFLVAGSPEAQPPAGWAPGPADRVIAVDRGYLHARAWRWPVHLLIGDLDSLPSEDVPSRDVLPIVTAPPAKDQTDLELALAQALAWRPDQIVICAALGGRPDHMLANILLLARADLAGRDVCIVEELSVFRLLRGGQRLALDGAAGDLLSLLPVGGPAIGLVTEGLLYPLRDETLALGEARGVSNVFSGSTAGVSLREGCLLVFHRSGGIA